jgi:hypothetical protein
MEKTISELRTPREVRDELENNSFTPDQALHIVEEVYQPLYLCIKELWNIVDQIDKRGY